MGKTRILRTGRLRSVFDTNVVVSALVLRGKLDWLHGAWASGAVVPIVCRETTGELIRVLAYPKFRLSHVDRDSLLAEYLPFAEVVPLPVPPPTVTAACRDRADLMFIQLAIAARADLLASGDADLTVLDGVVPVTSPAGLRLRTKLG